MPTPRPALSPAIIAAAVTGGVYTCAALIAAIATGNAEFVFYVVVMVVLGAAVGYVHWRVRLSAALIWLLTIWGGLHMAGGLVPVPESWPINGDIRVLYSWWIIPDGDRGGLLKFDQIVHVYGFGVTCWLCWQALRNTMTVMHNDEPPRPTFGLLTMCALASCGLGAFNEIVEFIATLITTTNVGGYVNTGFDLVSNMVGAIIAAVLIRLFEK